MNTTEPRVNDILEINATACIASLPEGAPPWVARRMRELPWVVTRRPAAAHGHVSAGICGRYREERFAAEIARKHVRRILPPPHLLAFAEWAAHQELPAIRSLLLLRQRWIDLRLPWGPAGSIAFTLASEMPIATSQSDLDVVIYATGTRRLSKSEAQSLITATASLPSAVDIRVETDHGGFSLVEYGRTASGPILLHTVHGPVMIANPWDAGLGSKLRTSGSNRS